MTIEALWTAEFEVAQRGWTNVGIVVLESGRVFGGDGQYYYVGTYKLDHNNRISASMRATHYNGEVSTAFGTKEPAFNLSVLCEWDGQGRIEGVVGRPELGATLNFRMVKRANLP